MNLRFDLLVLAVLAGVMAVFLMVPAACALAWGEPARPFALSIAAAAALGALGWLAGRGSHGSLRPRDGYLVVTAGWLLASFVAALPYLLSGATGPVDAWFEAVSGITTTGSTILTDIEALPGSLLLWRSLSQWIGGMGIILFTIAVLPILGVGGMGLFKAEVPGPVTDKLTPRLVETARYLWYIYVGLTLAETLLLRVFGMPWFEAVCHSFTTMATGGFSPRNASIGAYESHAIRVTVIVFMLFAGANFVLYFRLLSGRLRQVRDDSELRWYLLLVVLFTVPMTGALMHNGASRGVALEDAAFTVVSLMTTTGYATADFELWPASLLGPIVILLILGGMNGSTGGGIKAFRSLIAVRALRSAFRKLVRPHVVRPIAHQGRPIPESVMESIWAFLAAYAGLAVVGFLVLTSSNVDLVTAATASLTALGNVGPGLGDVGPSEHFFWMPAHAKICLSLLMICGRLEIFSALILIAPSFWRR